MAREKLQELLGMVQAGDPATIEAARAGMLMVQNSWQIDFNFIIYGVRACTFTHCGLSRLWAQSKVCDMQGDKVERKWRML